MLAIAASVCVFAADGSASAASCARGCCALRAQSATASPILRSKPGRPESITVREHQSRRQRHQSRDAGQGGPLTGTSGPRRVRQPERARPVPARARRAQRNADVSCHKACCAVLAFARRLSDECGKERRTRRVYRADAVVTQVSATGAASGTGANNSGGSTATASNDTSTAPPVQTCSKGALALRAAPRRLPNRRRERRANRTGVAVRPMGLRCVGG